MKPQVTGVEPGTAKTSENEGRGDPRVKPTAGRTGWGAGGQDDSGK